MKLLIDHKANLYARAKVPGTSMSVLEVVVEYIKTLYPKDAADI